MNNYVKKHIKGAALIEYVLIAGMLAVAATAIMSTVGVSITSMFTTINTKLTPAP